MADILQFTASNNALHASARGTFQANNTLANVTVLGVQQSVSTVTLNGMSIPSSGVDYSAKAKALTVTGLSNATTGGAWSQEWVLRWT